MQSALELINPHLYAVEERIRLQAQQFDPKVEGYVAYACESRGKRLRPALALLAGGATGHIGSSHLDLAVVIELIHCATLVHDDIMDGAEKRRNLPTVNAKWGNTISVLLGDCLFAHALKISTSFSHAEISRRIASAASDVCSGEIMQTQRRFDLKLGVADYFRIIEMKTAALFAVATELGAFLNEAAPEVILAMKNFGMKLGTAYQIYDDCVDLAGREEVAGKTLGSDLRKGKLTLPLLHVLQTTTEAERHELRDAILRGDTTDLEAIFETARAQGGLAAAVAAAKRLLTEARDSLGLLPPNKYHDGLLGICTSLEAMLAQFLA